MALRHRQCAYCGTKDHPRTKGHVFSAALYPEALSKAKRITVPECESCKEIWGEAEHKFRNIFTTTRNPNDVIKDDRFNAQVRGFLQKDGEKRWNDLVETFVSKTIDGKQRDVIFPAKDPEFNLILRRIVRGLVYEHKLDTCVSDEQVICSYMKYTIPDSFIEEMTWVEIAPDFIEYGFKKFDEELLHSFWQVTFHGHMKYFGRVVNKGWEDSEFTV